MDLHVNKEVRSPSQTQCWYLQFISLSKCSIEQKPYLIGIPMPPNISVVLQTDKKAASDRPSDQLLLWAVEGLAGIVINGIPNNVPGTRALNTPKAVLWGQQDALLTWPGKL